MRRNRRGHRSVFARFAYDDCKQVLSVANLSRQEQRTYIAFRQRRTHYAHPRCVRPRPPPLNAIAAKGRCRRLHARCIQNSKPKADQIR